MRGRLFSAQQEGYSKGLRLAYWRGREAARTGVKRDECPYSRADFRASWIDGHDLQMAENAELTPLRKYTYPQK